MRASTKHDDPLECAEGMRTNTNTPTHIAAATAAAMTMATPVAETLPTVSGLLETFNPNEIIKAEMNKLCLDEREKVYEDVHGVNDLDDETPSFLTAKLDDMSVQIHVIEDKPAYDLAQKLDPSYVEDPKLRLMFLRFDGYDSTVAAKRMVDWFETKLRLFGKELLVETITLEDLNAEAAELVTSGCCQVLPVRDSAGRVVICVRRLDEHMLKHPNANVMGLFYFAMLLLKDEETQRNGVVWIRNGFVDRSEIDMSACRGLYKVGRLSGQLPLRFRACHFISESQTTSQQISTMIQLSVISKVRHRCRSHTGSVQHCKDTLRGYGIPADLMPIKDNGETSYDNHLPWVEQVRRQETEILLERQQRKQQRRHIEATAMPSSIDDPAFRPMHSTKSTDPAQGASVVAPGFGHFHNNQHPRLHPEQAPDAENIGNTAVHAPHHASFPDQYVVAPNVGQGYVGGVTSTDSPSFHGDHVANNLRTPATSSHETGIVNGILMQSPTLNHTNVEQARDPTNDAHDSIDVADDLNEDYLAQLLGLVPSEFSDADLSEVFGGDTLDVAATNNHTNGSRNGVNAVANTRIELPIACSASTTTPALRSSDTKQHVDCDGNPSLISTETSDGISGGNRIHHEDARPNDVSVSLTPTPRLIETPTEFDVLLGRGRPFQNHSGNQYLRTLVAEWYDTYDTSPRKGKTPIAERLVYLVHKRGGRFIKRVCEGGMSGWVEVEFSEASGKAAHAFRKRRETMANAQKREESRAKAASMGTKAETLAEGKRMKVGS